MDSSAFFPFPPDGALDYNAMEHASEHTRLPAARTDSDHPRPYIYLQNSLRSPPAIFFFAEGICAQSLYSLNTADTQLCVHVRFSPRRPPRERHSRLRNRISVACESGCEHVDRLSSLLAM